MSYLKHISFQQPLKNSQKINSTQSLNPELSIPSTSSYLKSFKKTITNNNINHTKNQLFPNSFDNQQNIKPIKNHHNNETLFSKQKQKNKNQFKNIEHIIKENQNQMEQLLNSSINQFQKLIIHEDLSESLEQQNYRLKNTLYKVKNILKDKLQFALQKQKEELSKMLQDYISLITKLLQDKQELTIKIQDITEEYEKKYQQMEQQFHQKVIFMDRERDQQINSTKNQIEQFMGIIQQYEEQAKQEQIKFDQMQQRINQLEEQRDNYLCISKDGKNEQQSRLKIEAQSFKIKNLLQLLQKTQKQNNEFKAEISKYKSKQNSNNLTVELKQLKESYQRKIEQMQQQHQQQFMEYEKAIRDTLMKKQECIQRLNLIIEGQRERKSHVH